MTGFQEKEGAMGITVIGAVVNLVLTGAKFAAGVFGNSAAMIADAVHSLSDLGSDAVVLFGLKISAKPRDKSHQYGHGKVETSAAVAVGLILAAAGFYLFWSGARELYEGRHTTPTALALVAALVSIVSKEALYQVTARIGRREKKPSVVANAWHHRSDALSSVAALAGIGGSMAGVNHLDQIAAVAVSIFVIQAGIGIGWKAYLDLLDTSVGDRMISQMEAMIAETEGVIDFHKLRTRRVGSAVFVDLHLVVDGNMTVKEAHDIADVIEAKLKVGADVGDVTVHVEEYECDRPEACRFPNCDNARR